ncbi:hypothetical protein BH18PSE1_BH18PSE1_08880 [soil metagenome]
MSLGTILIVLIVLLVGAIPSWPYSSGWGYGPSSILGTVLAEPTVLQWPLMSEDCPFE